MPYSLRQPSYGPGKRLEVSTSSVWIKICVKRPLKKGFLFNPTIKNLLLFFSHLYWCLGPELTGYNQGIKSALGSCSMEKS